MKGIVLAGGAGTRLRGGAGVRSCGNSEYVRGDLFSRWGRAGFFFLRHVEDNDAYFEVVDLTQGRPPMLHHVEYAMAVDGMAFLGDFAPSGALGYSKDLHHYYIRDDDVTNVHVGFGPRAVGQLKPDKAQ